MANPAHSLTIISPYVQEQYDVTHHFPLAQNSQFILEDLFLCLRIDDYDDEYELVRMSRFKQMTETVGDDP